MTARLPWLVPAMLVLLAGCAADDDADRGSVSAAVSTVAVHQGSMPERLSAYGTAGPATDAVQVLAVQASGRVSHWAVTAGSRVTRGQRLLSFELAPAAVAAWRQARDALSLAQSQRTHTAQLLAQQLATRDQMDQADKAVRDAQSSLDALTRAQGSEATLELTAPFDGTVVAISAVQGDVLQPGSALLSVQRQDGLVITAGIERDALPRVQPGAEVELVPLDATAPMHGKVRRVAQALDPHTHLINVEIVPDGTPVSGEAFRADIVVGQWQGWLLPRDAVLGDESQRYVFQVAKDHAVRVPVQVQGETDSISVATGGLDASRPLVTEGATQLDDGMAVRAGTPEVRP
ncbi:efflux RND transporter periplasmic adaptor subunit [Dyella sp. C9]|uniref:efflux RND transporter periplasmic adaptor subunit n=1 Tax=Dyella sp. C9 TaxID=2202154 RepID=UPI000DEF4003|nr:efflux RND transporter periplasmic adaptor subunit [Dyella sp. C9]